MSVLGRDADHDPLDYSRKLICEIAGRHVMYGGMLQALIEDRDDDGARVMFKRIVALDHALKIAFDTLGVGRAAQPARDAKAYFEHLRDSLVAPP